MEETKRTITDRECIEEINAAISQIYGIQELLAALPKGEFMTGDHKYCADACLEEAAKILNEALQNHKG
jgi:hypothetical protein